LREKHKLRVFESRALKKKFGSKRNEVTGEWRRRHKVQLYDRDPSYYLGDQIKNYEVGGACSMY
jgi:hypothetical protein